MKQIVLLLLVLVTTQVQAEQVRLSTNLGDIILELDGERAPVSVANFLAYLDNGAYDETIFHRVIPSFVVQGGGHYLDMTLAPEGDAIFNEAENGLKNLRGTIAMARMSEIDSATRQFFINVADNDRLDHQPDSCTREDEAKAAAARERGAYRPTTCKSFGYAVFGKVVSGMDVVDLIELTDTTVDGEHDDVPVTPIIILTAERVEADDTGN